MCEYAQSVNSYQRTILRTSSLRPFRWLLSKVLTPLDVNLRNTRFAPSAFGVDFPLCYLTTTGRKSGQERTVPLLYTPTANGFGVVATNFGTEHHPGWSYNLDANPDAVLDINGTPVEITAHRASGHVADRVWRQLRDVWPAYDTYQDVAGRDIRAYELRTQR